MGARTLARGDVLLLIVTLAAFGIATSAYLAWQWHASASASWCDLDAYFSCTKVRESAYAAVAGIPTAWVGVVGFALLLSLAVVSLRGQETLGPWSTEVWLLVLSALGVAIGTGLTLIEVFIIQAICVLCVLGFALGLAVLGLVAVLPKVR